MSITGEDSTIEKSKEAVFKSDLTNYRDEYTRKEMEKQLEAGGTLDKSVLNNKTGDYLKAEGYISSLTEKYIGKLGTTAEGKLVYKDITNEEEFGWAAELNMADLSGVLAGKVEVGQYIKYTPGAGTHVANKEQTGHSADQTFTSVATEEDWRVLSVKGAEVTIVRQDPIYPTENSNGLTLYGQTGYDNAVQELNNICGIYKDNKYAKEARSITVEDVNGVTGYSSSDMAAYGGGSSNDGGYGYTGVPEYGDGVTEYTSDHYSYAGTSTSKQLKTTDEEYKMLFKNKANSSNISYWVASRCVFVNIFEARFGVRNVVSSSVYTCYLYYSNSIERGYVVGVRPVVVLKSNVRVSGSGTSTEPYTITEN